MVNWYLRGIESIDHYWDNLDRILSPTRGRSIGLNWNNSEIDWTLNSKVSNDEIILTLGVPGYCNDDISVDVDGDKLTISIEKDEKKSKKSYIISSDYDLDNAKANVHHGLLTINVPLNTKSRKKIL